MKAGVLSTFYNNYNYGGKLQAYAMIKAIQQVGWDAEQISYYQPSGGSSNSLFVKGKKFCLSKDYRRAFFQVATGKCLRLDKEMKIRKQAFNCFDSKIPHTEQVYSDNTISSVGLTYDAFICGSDQIWNPNLYKKSYYLDFVPANKYKFSYAASVASKTTERWRNICLKKLMDFQAVSVRERDSQILLSDLLKKDVFLCVDPTLLLEPKEWEMLSEKCILREPYVFCYFLGYGRKMRNIAKSFAREQKCRLVTMPQLLETTGRFYLEDIAFGDEQLFDISPEEFMSLIRHAEYVMTDSFHASIMSIIFQKQFVIFDRNGHIGMGSRVQDLLNMFELQERRCSLNDSYSTVCSKLCRTIEYQDRYPAFECRKNDSWQYLTQNLRKAECWIENEKKSN